MPDLARRDTIQGCRHRRVRSSTTSLRRATRPEAAAAAADLARLEPCRLPVVFPPQMPPPAGLPGDPP